MDWSKQGIIFNRKIDQINGKTPWLSCLDELKEVNKIEKRSSSKFCLKML